LSSEPRSRSLPVPLKPCPSRQLVAMPVWPTLVVLQFLDQRFFERDVVPSASVENPDENVSQFDRQALRLMVLKIDQPHRVHARLTVLLPCLREFRMEVCELIADAALRAVPPAVFDSCFVGCPNQLL